MRRGEAVTKVGALNWAVENVLTGGVHGVWTLANPVHRADMALAAPSEALRSHLGVLRCPPGSRCGLYGRSDAQSHGGRPARRASRRIGCAGKRRTALRRAGGLYSLSVATSKSLQDGGGSQLRRVRALHALGRLPGRISSLRSWVRPIGSMTASSTLWTRRKSPGSRARWSATGASGSSKGAIRPGGG